jgi:hypothetical protein
MRTQDKERRSETLVKGSLKRRTSGNKVYYTVALDQLVVTLNFFYEYPTVKGRQGVVGFRLHVASHASAIVGFSRNACHN